MGYIDLHTHSTASDGTLTPTELVRHAVEIGVSVLALTDHDTVSGLPEAAAEADRVNAVGADKFTFIPGIEFSAAYQGRDIHILGLGIDRTDTGLNKAIAEAVSEREGRNEKIAQLFRDAGIPIHVEDFYKERKDASITRAHFAKYLLDNGYVKSSAEAFEKYLNPGRKYYIPREIMQPENAISIILNAGGVPVLAHPLLYKLTPAKLEALIQELVTYGLQGLEVFYSSNINNDTDYMRSLANKYNLKMTGGSDFHGTNKPDLEIGVGRGNLVVPDDVLSWKALIN